MGTGASHNISGLTITLTNLPTNGPFYLAGENVQCTVQFNGMEYDPDEELKGAYIELIGQIVYTTLSTTTDGNGNTRTTTTVHEAPFFTERQNFHSELTPENTMTISHFDIYHEWSFNFTLPVELPPSLPPIGGACNSQPYVIYFIRAVLELKKWYHTNIRHSIPISVYPRTDVQDHFDRPIEVENENRNHVHLHVIAPRSVILPEIPVIIHYDLHNPNRSTVEEIIVKLYQYRQIGKRGSFKTFIFKMEVPDANEFRGEHLHDKFELTIPMMRLPPTSSYIFANDTGLTQFNPISVTYELVMEMKMHGFFTDFSLKFPVIMGIEANNRSPPPSYASTMKLS